MSYYRHGGRKPFYHDSRFLKQGVIDKYFTALFFKVIANVNQLDGISDWLI